MDGNGRWARRRRLPPVAGHRAGTRALKRTVEAAPELGVRSLAVYAFSTENWGRPDDEVRDLMELFADTIRNEFPDLHRQGVRVRFVGRRDRCSDALMELMDDMEQRTSGNTRLDLWVAFDYGARDEIVQAARRLVEDGVPPDGVDQHAVASRLYAPDMPDPDLSSARPGSCGCRTSSSGSAPTASTTSRPAVAGLRRRRPPRGAGGVRHAAAKVRAPVSSLASRVLVAVPLIALALFAVYAGGWVLVVGGGGGRGDRAARVLRDVPRAAAADPGRDAGWCWCWSRSTAAAWNGRPAPLLATLAFGFWLSAVSHVRQRASCSLR